MIAPLLCLAWLLSLEDDLMKLKKNNISDLRTPEHVWAVFQSKLVENFARSQSSVQTFLHWGLSLVSFVPRPPACLQYLSTPAMLYDAMCVGRYSSLSLSLQTIYQSLNDLKP